MNKRTKRYVFPWKGRRTALVAHADSQALKYLKEALSREGYAAVVCTEPRVVLEHRRAGHAFAVLEDGAAAVETLQALREQGNPIPVILLSRAGHRERRDSGVVNVSHLHAPYTRESLRLAIVGIDHSDPIPPALPDRDR